MPEALTAIILGSSISRLISTKLVEKFHLNFFEKGLLLNIPGLSPDLANQKTTDITNFLLILVVSLIVYLFLDLRQKYILAKNKDYLKYLDVSFALLVYLQSHFVTTSFTTLAITVLSFFSLTTYYTLKHPLIKPNLNFTTLVNGLLMGLSIFLNLKLITTSIIFPVTSLLLSLVYYSQLKETGYKFYKSNLHLLLTLLFFLPAKLTIITPATLAIYSLIFFVKQSEKSQKLNEYLYPVTVILILSYNFRYLIGNFDTVEEGFWLAWFQRLNNGQVLYKDVWVYHQPLLIWLGFAFQKLFGFSIANVRLYFHLLQIASYIIFYFAISKITNKKFYRFLLTFLVAVLTSTQVRNNVEIRLALATLSVLFAKENPFYSGFFSSISFFISPEVGISSMVANILHLIYLSWQEKKLSKFKKYAVGALLPTLVITSYLVLSKSFNNYLDQTVYYAKAFSLGYFNLPMDKAIRMSLFHWHIFYQYLNSTAFYWELTGCLLILGLIRGLVNKNSSIASLSLFGLLVFRSALGRSDYYHLLFPLVISLIVFVNEIKDSSFAKWIIAVTLLVIFRTETNSVYLENFLYRFQTYNQLIGEYKLLGGQRGGIYVDKESMPDDKNKLYTFIKDSATDSGQIFVFPWSPEIYYLTEQRNSTKNDTPYAFFTEKYQQETISDLKGNPPDLVIYSPNFSFGNMSVETLPLINRYLKENYYETNRFDNQIVLKKNNL